MARVEMVIPAPTAMTLQVWLNLTNSASLSNQETVNLERHAGSNTKQTRSSTQRAHPRQGKECLVGWARSHVMLSSEESALSGIGVATVTSLQARLVQVVTL
jgi:hypothetical protein